MAHLPIVKNPREESSVEMDLNMQMKNEKTTILTMEMDETPIVKLRICTFVVEDLPLHLILVHCV